jgi:hypothetical protein
MKMKKEEDTFFLPSHWPGLDTVAVHVFFLQNLLSTLLSARREAHLALFLVVLSLFPRTNRKLRQGKREITTLLLTSPC